MNKTIALRLAGCLLAACFAAIPAHAQPQSQSQPEEVARLADLVVQAMPVGDLFQGFIDRDARWPLNEKVDRVPPEQLACLRQRLSSAGYRERQAAAVAGFARQHPDRVAPSIRVLEEGAAEMFAAAITAGAEQSRTGRKADFNDIAGRFRPTQMAAMVELTSDERHRALRELIGIDDALGIEHSPEQNRSRGRNKGMLLGMKLMFSAMEHCKVPLTAVQ